MKVELPLGEIYKTPTIEALARTIKQISEYDHHIEQPYLLLNQPQKPKIFCFPPIAGYGLTYKELADRLDEYSVYGFDFIEMDDPVQEYIKLILEIQKNGPYVLFGYSAGGNLAFEVAKGLMNAGYLVSDVILLDAVKSTEPVYTTPKEIEEGVKRLLDVDITDPWLKEFLEIEAVKEKVKAKIGKYIAYTDQLVNEGMIDADIHFIVAEVEESYKDCW
ncbi:MAG: hypothetical protein KAX49_06645 [Halanaerobiales bacterium]|nr:hypothetical protein [Halanaerobiales bacterium]